MTPATPIRPPRRWRSRRRRVAPAGGRPSIEARRPNPGGCLSIVLLVLGCVLAPIGVTAGWAKNLVVDQHAYLEAVDPLITDPAIVNAAEARPGRRHRRCDHQAEHRRQDRHRTAVARTAAEAGHAGHHVSGDVPHRHHQRDHQHGRRTGHQSKGGHLWNNANATLHSKFVQIMQGESPGKLHTLNVDLSCGGHQGQGETGGLRRQLGGPDTRRPGGHSTSPETPMCSGWPATTTCWTRSALGCRSSPRCSCCCRS